jgi:hypothetical protein
LDKLAAAHDGDHLHFFNDLAHLAERKAFAAHLAPWRKAEWAVFAKRPFAGPTPWGNPHNAMKCRLRPN